MCNGLNSFYWALPSSKVSYLDTKEEDSSSIKPLYHKKQAKRQETDLPQICREWKERVHLCREGFRASDCDANKRVHRSFLPERIENRGPRAGLRHYLPLRQVATCKTATGVWPSKHEQLTRPAPSPRDQLGKKLHALPCTDFSPTEAFLHKPVFFENLLTLESFYSLCVIENTLSHVDVAYQQIGCAKIINTFLPLITSTIGLP